RGAVLDGDAADHRGARGQDVEHAIERLAVDDGRGSAVTRDADGARNVEIAGGGLVFTGPGARDQIRACRQADDVGAEDRVGLLDRGAQRAMVVRRPTLAVSRRHVDAVVGRVDGEGCRVRRRRRDEQSHPWHEGEADDEDTPLALRLPHTSLLCLGVGPQIPAASDGPAMNGCCPPAAWDLTPRRVQPTPEALSRDAAASSPIDPVRKTRPLSDLWATRTARPCSEMRAGVD